MKCYTLGIDPDECITVGGPRLEWNPQTKQWEKPKAITPDVVIQK